jgi:hypothetical protein
LSMKAEVGRQYKHYKGGVYTVLAIGHLEANPAERMVVYQSEYDTTDYPRGTVWIRPVDSFNGTIVIDDLEQERFMQI